MISIGSVCAFWSFIKKIPWSLSKGEVDAPEIRNNNDIANRCADYFSGVYLDEISYDVSDLYNMLYCSFPYALKAAWITPFYKSGDCHEFAY